MVYVQEGYIFFSFTIARIYEVRIQFLAELVAKDEGYNFNNLVVGYSMVNYIANGCRLHKHHCYIKNARHIVMVWQPAQ